MTCDGYLQLQPVYILRHNAETPSKRKVSGAWYLERNVDAEDDAFVHRDKHGVFLPALHCMQRLASCQRCGL